MLPKAGSWKRTGVVFLAFVFLFVLFFPLRAYGSDWPAYRFDAQRSGYTPEELPRDLSLLWVWSSPSEPDPAWRGPDTRMAFDWAFEVISASGLVFFGSSADCTVYALEAGTGKTKWTFLTEAPIRFAPVFREGRLYVASDDGFLYCLRAEDGALVWKHRGAPSMSMVLGNDHMISRWPARGGPVLLEGTVYYAAGIWPSEGIFIYAVDAESGKEKWRNDKSGSLYMPQPHGGAEAKSGVSAQGYLAATKELLFVPTGRAVPAAFDCAEGKLKYFHLQRYGHFGGCDVVAFDSYFINAGNLYDGKSGLLLRRGVGKCVVGPHTFTAVNSKEFALYNRASLWKLKTGFDRKGTKITRKEFSRPLRRCGHFSGEVCSVIGAGESLVLGAPGKVGVFDLRSGKKVLTLKVEGRPYGLAVSEGKLYVSTDRGKIYCFGAGGGKARVWGPDLANPVTEEIYKQAALEIVEKTGVREGFCLDIACGDGSLALALARTTSLRIYAVEKDPKLRAEAVALLKSAGLYGRRVTVHNYEVALYGYPDYFADLIVAGRSVKGKQVDLEPWLRCMRPFGGVACLSEPGRMQLRRRGPLKGAGSWTHQYADPGNTGCSGDKIVGGPLKVLWFRDRDFPMPSRHGRGPAPLFAEGLLFVEGLNALRCVNAYNGRTVWEYPLPGILKPYDQEHLLGVAGTGSNFCLGAETVYVRRDGECLKIDKKTGSLIRSFKAPREPGGAPGTWGLVFYEDGRLFGTLSDTSHIVKWRFGRSDMSRLFTESLLLFALDCKSGRELWRYRPRHSIRNNAIAVGGGRVYVIDRPKAQIDRIDYSSLRRGKKAEADVQPPGTLVALDASEGRILWSTSEDIFGTLLVYSKKYDILLMAYQDTRFKLDSEVGGRLAAFRATSGRRLWDIKIHYMSRPVVNGRTIYVEPWAVDLLSGRKLEGFNLRRSYGCGTLAGSCNLLLFRSATLGYVDLRRGSRLENYGGIRPGCWINAIPAGGLVLMPDASARCVCSYLNSASIALIPSVVGESRN